MSGKISVNTGWNGPDKPDICGKALDMLHKSDEAETGADHNRDRATLNPGYVPDGPLQLSNCKAALSKPALSIC